VWVIVTFGAGLVGFIISLWALWKVQLVKAVPLTIAVTVAAATVTALRSPLISLPVALLSAVVVMAWCKRYPPWATESAQGRAA
jgi:hypothetical protein